MIGVDASFVPVSVHPGPGCAAAVVVAPAVVVSDVVLDTGVVAGSVSLVSSPRNMPATRGKMAPYRKLVRGCSHLRAMRKESMRTTAIMKKRTRLHRM